MTTKVKKIQYCSITDKMQTVLFMLNFKSKQKTTAIF